MADDVKRFTRAEIAGGAGADTVFIIDNVVYDVTGFLDEHPGGHEVLVHARGRDASEDFADVGHSFDAKELMRKYAVGELVDADRAEVARRPAAWAEPPAQRAAAPTFLASWQLPLLLGALVTLLYTYLLG